MCAFQASALAAFCTSFSAASFSHFWYSISSISNASRKLGAVRYHALTFDKPRSLLRKNGQNAVIMHGHVLSCVIMHDLCEHA